MRDLLTKDTKRSPSDVSIASPICARTAGSGNTNCINSTWTKIGLTATPSFDPRGIVDSTNSLITVPESAFYFMHAWVWDDGTRQHNSRWLQIRDEASGVYVTDNRTYAVAGGMHCNAMCMVPLYIGKKLDIWYFQNTGFTIGANGSFVIYKLGPLP